MLTRLACIGVIALASIISASPPTRAMQRSPNSSTSTTRRSRPAGRTWRASRRSKSAEHRSPRAMRRSRRTWSIIETSLKVQQTYCNDVAAALELLRADPKATYKSISKQVDERDRTIRADRKASKAALADTQPVICGSCRGSTRRPAAPAAAPAKKTPGQVPERTHRRSARARRHLEGVGLGDDGHGRVHREEGRLDGDGEIVHRRDLRSAEEGTRRRSSRRSRTCSSNRSPRTSPRSSRAIDLVRRRRSAWSSSRASRGRTAACSRRCACARDRAPDDRRRRSRPCWSR